MTCIPGLRHRYRESCPSVAHDISWCAQASGCPGKGIADEARRTFRRGQKIDPWQRTYFRQELLISEARFEWDAEGYIRRACEQEARKPGPHREAAGEFKRALELCDKALAINLGLNGVYLTRAACFLRLQDYEGAAKAYEHALAEGREFHQAAA